MTDPGSAEQIELTRRVVVDAELRRHLQREAFLAVFLLPRRWALFGVMLVLLAGYSYVRIGGDLGTASRVMSALLTAAMATVVAVALVTLIVGVQVLQAGRRLPDGSEYASGFGDREMRLRSPLVEMRVAYDDVLAVRERSHLVSLTLRGFSVPANFPRALFGDAELARLRRA